MRKILITGTSGFVGRNLLPYLSEDSKVTTMSRKELKEMAPETLQDVNVMVHLAGKAHDLKDTTDSQEYYDVNTKLTIALYNLFLSSDAETFIFLSSVKAVADHLEGILYEDVAPMPMTHYGKSKLEAEKYLMAQPLPPEKRLYILRPCMIHGPGNKGNLNLLYNIVKMKIPYPLSSFKNRRSFLSIDNLNFVIKELSMPNNRIESGIFNVADDESLSTSEVVILLSMAQHQKARFIKIPKLIIRWVAKLGDVLKLPLNSERLSKLTENYVVSNIKLVKAIGRPLPVSSREGMLRTARSFSEYEDGNN